MNPEPCECYHDCDATTAAGDRIQYCPTHDAAPEMLALLEEALGSANYSTQKRISALLARIERGGG